jgi:LacI family xylobiose transport system transcriptional regulator
MRFEYGSRQGRRRGDTTVASIARLAGVSSPTVSKVLNGRSGVATDTRRRVEALLLEHGYRRPDAISPAAVLEVVFYTLEGYRAMEVMRGVERVAKARELAVGFSEVKGREREGRGWLEHVLARRPLGLIGACIRFTPEEQERLAASAIPLVALGPVGAPLDTTPSVGAANRSGGAIAARHLLDLGHQRIGAIGGPASFLCAQARLDGSRAELEAAGRPADPALVLSGGYSFEDGLAMGRVLLAQAKRPTAIVCGDDLQALGVYEAAREIGLRIPRDLSVVGFGDVEYARWSGPPLTTVRQPLADMGAAAANLVLTLAARQQPTHTRIELATTLVQRASTAPPQH